jgi:hypothetical protein
MDHVYLDGSILKISLPLDTNIQSATNSRIAKSVSTVAWVVAANGHAVNSHADDAEPFEHLSSIPTGSGAVWPEVFRSK